MLKNYFAAYEGVAEVIDNGLLDVMPYRLVSYEALKTGAYDDKIFKYYRDSYTSLILDSGAYSAWTKKSPIWIKDYQRYCKKHFDKITYFVNLDIIPGAPGMEPTAEDRKYSAEQGYNHYWEMVKFLGELGVERNKIIHVFHQFEDIEYLKQMVDVDKMEYIGLSPSNDRKIVNTERKREFLQECFEIVAPDGIPKCKTHAFGVSSFDLLGSLLDPATGQLKPQFPLYSADARTWGRQAMGGYIFVPAINASIPETSRPQSRTSKLEHPRTFAEWWDFSKIETVDVGNQSKRDSYWKAVTPDGEYKISEKRRKEIVAYVHDLGLHFGYSEIHKKSNRELPGNNELEITDTRTIARLNKQFGKLQKGEMWTEEFIRDGILPYVQYRMWINCIAVNHWTQVQDPLGYYTPDHIPDHELTPEEEKARAIVQDKIRRRLNE